MSALDSLLDEVVERLAARLTERLRAGERGMIAQSNSPLGRRRHCSAVKRRLAQCESGAAIVGRQHLLSADALAEELQRASGRAKSAASPRPGSVRAELLAELRLAQEVRRRG